MDNNAKNAGICRPGRKGFMRIFSRILVLIVLVYVLFVLTGRALRKIAITQITEMVGTKVTAESLDLGFDGSVLIKNLAVLPWQRLKYDNTIFKARTVYARFSLASVLLFSPRLKTISVNDFVFDAQFDMDTAKWNTACLKLKGGGAGGDRIPFVVLENGILRYSRVSNSCSKTIAGVPLDAVLKPAENIKNACIFTLATASTGTFGRNTLNGFWRPGLVTIAGGIASADLPAFERVWKINVLAGEIKYDHSGIFAVNLKIKDLQNKHAAPGFSPDLENILFPEKLAALKPLEAFFSRFRPAGNADLELQAEGNFQNLSQTTVVGRLYCRDITICDRKFPYTVEHIKGWVDFSENQVLLNNLIGRHGNVDLAFNGSLTGLVSNRGYQIQITSENMALDSDLYAALSEKKQEVWSDFAPAGTAAINYCISRQTGQSAEKALAVKLLNAAVTYRHFPYPLKNLTGTIYFQPDAAIISSLLCQENSRTISLHGRVSYSYDQSSAYEIFIKAENLPLDNALAAALPAEESQLCTELARTGLINIEKLTGKVWAESATARPCYHLSLNTKQFQLSNDLIALLPPTMEKVVTDLQPSGNISVAADLLKDSSDSQLNYELTVNCLKNNATLQSLGYPLADICGTVTANKDSVTLNDITARVAHSIQIAPYVPTVKLNGHIIFAEKNPSVAHLQLSATDILFDKQFGLALPESLVAAYRKLSPTGRLDLDSVKLEISNDLAGGRSINFDGRIELKNCSFNTSPVITKAYAKFDKVRGSYSRALGLGATTARLVTADFRLKAKALTNAAAEGITYHPDGRTWLADNLVADCYDGTVTGKFQLKQADTGTWEYQLQSGFADIDLKQFLLDPEESENPAAAEQAQQNQNRTAGNDCTTGRMHGSLSAYGRLGSSDSRIGRCRLAITDMKLGKMSPLAKLLNVLKLTQPADFAFEQMLMDSYINHDKLFFQKFDLSGQALAFSGSGFMDLQNNSLDLTLTARGRRLASAEPDVLQSLTEGLGHAVVRMDINGTLYDPKVTTTALPVIKQSLQILGTKP